jgi:hypothetical protein
MVQTGTSWRTTPPLTPPPPDRLPHQLIILPPPPLRRLPPRLRLRLALRHRPPHRRCGLGLPRRLGRRGRLALRARGGQQHGILSQPPRLPPVAQRARRGQLRVALRLKARVLGGGRGGRGGLGRGGGGGRGEGVG